MFTTSIVSRFEAAVQVAAEKINPGAKLQLRPATLTMLREVAAKHRLCKRCLGFGVVSVGKDDREQVCPLCSGSVNRPSMADPAPRLEILNRVLVSWDGVKAYDPARKTEVDLDLTDDVRAGIPSTEAYEEILRLARGLVTRVEEEEEGNSEPPPVAASATVSEEIGTGSMTSEEG